MKVAKISVLGLLLLFVGLAVLPTSAQLSPSPFLFMKDLRVGMEGIGKTTIGGDEIRIFQTRIIGLIDNPGELNDYILVRSSGDLIREAGGYAQGMSGSPIYINDRLVGAFFAAFLYDESPNPIGLVRPIETVLQLVEPIRKAVGAQSQNSQESLQPIEHVLRRVRLENGPPKDVQFVSSPPSFAERRANPDTLYAVRTGAPLWASGLSGRALDWLKRGIASQALARFASGLLPGASFSQQFLDELQWGFEERYGVTIYPTSSADTQVGEFSEEFEPGRPMAALLTTGDVLFGGVCTTTYIDPQTRVLLACGHPLFLTGDARLFLAKARVIDTVNSAPISFVLPQVDRTEVVGAVLQDRTQAIGAALSYQLPAVRLVAHLKDLSTGKDRDFSVTIAPASTFVPSLVFASLLEAVDTTMNRIGPGTMRIEYTIRGTELPKRLARSDVFTHFSDIALFGPLQIAQVVFFLTQNEFTDPGLERIDVEITTTDAIRLLQVKAIQTDKEVYQAGETVRYTVQLKPYRGSERLATGSFTLPKDLKVRSLTLYVFGGPRRQQNNQQPLPQVDSLDQLIQALERSTTNDQLTVELLGLPQETGEDEESKPFQDIQKLGDWVVTGEGRTTIKIQMPEKSKEEQKQEPPQEPEKKCPQLFYC